MTDPYDEKDTNFRRELAALINKHSLENESDTPDFMLANYLRGCMTNFGHIMMSRDSWYERKNK